MQSKPEDQKDLSYFSEYIQAFNSQAYGSGMFMLSPQILNSSIKELNMISSNFSTDQIRRMVMQPHLYEQELRKLSLLYFQTISLYQQTIKLWSNMLTFDWEPTPYTLDGKQISLSDMNSAAYKKDYAEMTKFFNSFNVKNEFSKVLWNICMYDTFYTSVREYDDHIYLQELPSSHCMIDSDSYLGYLFSFDLSYFTNSGVDINAFSPTLRSQYASSLRNTKINYNPNLPSRNGKWVQWTPMLPEDSWVFKFNSTFAGSVPPLLSALIDYSKIDKFKDLEEMKKELEAYKVIFATVPRLSGNKTGNKADDFSISAAELGKFVSAVKTTLNKGVDFKAAPLENFTSFDFSPASNEKNLLETELKNIMLQTGVSDAIGMPSSVNMASSGIYKTFNSTVMSNIYGQFNNFCEYQVNKRTKKYKYKIRYLGTMFDKEERRKNADSDMEKGLITPAIFSSRGIQITDANNVLNMMYSLGFPEILKPIKTASTMSSKEKESGREKKDDTELTDSGENTRTNGSNETSKGTEVKT
jgi:hypothetical protein